MRTSKLISFSKDRGVIAGLQKKNPADIKTLSASAAVPTFLTHRTTIQRMPTTTSQEPTTVATVVHQAEAPSTKPSPVIIAGVVILPEENISAAEFNKAPEASPPPTTALVLAKPIEVKTSERGKDTLQMPGIAQAPRRRASGMKVQAYFNQAELSVTDKATGATAILPTTSYYGVLLEFSQKWNEAFRTFQELKIGVAQFAPPIDANKTLEERTKLMSGVSLGLEYNFTQRLRVISYLRSQSELFSRARTTNTLTIDSVNEVSLGVDIAFDYLVQEPFVMGAAGLLEFKMPARTSAYDIQSGFLYGARIYVKDRSAAGAYPDEISLGYTQRAQDTSLVKQNEANLFFSLRYLFGGEK